MVGGAVRRARGIGRYVLSVPGVFLTYFPSRLMGLVLFEDQFKGARKSSKAMPAQAPERRCKGPARRKPPPMLLQTGEILRSRPKKPPGVDPRAKAARAGKAGIPVQKRRTTRGGGESRHRRLAGRNSLLLSIYFLIVFIIVAGPVICRSNTDFRAYLVLRPLAGLADNKRAKIVFNGPFQVGQASRRQRD